MISVIIPSYNRQNTIVEAINSVLNQTYQEVEVIVVDDGSTDDTIQLLNNISDPRIVIVHQNHKGACAARNRGIEVARGKYIAFHDSDDLCKQNRLEIQKECLERNDADIVCGNVLTHLDGKTFVSPGYSEGWLDSPDKLFNITTMSFFGKTSVFRKFMFDPEMPRWQDLDLLLAMYGKASIYFCEEVLCDYYRDGDSMSLNPQKCLDAFELIIRKYPSIKSDGGLLYSRLLKMYADSKVVMGRKDYYSDYKNVFYNNKSFVNFVWLCFSRVGLAHTLYRYLHRK